MMKIYSKNRTKRAIVASVLMLVVAAVGIGVGLYLNSAQTQDIRSSAGEESFCVPDEIEKCSKIFGSCSVIGVKTCSPGATWGVCVADDPRIHNCNGRECGDDGCGGICGSCAGDNICGTTGLCEITTVEESDESLIVFGGKNILVKIILQLREEQTKDSILLELWKGENLISSEEVSSGVDGITKVWNVSEIELGNYYLRVKPQGYLSQKKIIELSNDNPVYVFEEEFLAGDIINVDDLTFLTNASLTADSRADFDGDGYVKSKDRMILESNLLMIGSMPSE